MSGRNGRREIGPESRLGRKSAPVDSAHPEAPPYADANQHSNNEENNREKDPTLLEQMGGVSGLVSVTLPVLVLVPVNSLWGLGPALIAALAVAVGILIWRVVRKENPQPAISAFLGVAICAGIAWVTGDAKGYFLYGIWVSLLLGIGGVLSIVVRWPLVGVIWKGLNGDGMEWQRVASARRAYAVATAVWALLFFARFFVQNALYNTSETVQLGPARILMGWPLTAVAVIVTIWMARRAQAAVDSTGNHQE